MLQSQLLKRFHNRLAHNLGFDVYSGPVSYGDDTLVDQHAQSIKNNATLCAGVSNKECLGWIMYAVCNHHSWKQT